MPSIGTTANDQGGTNMKSNDAKRETKKKPMMTAKERKLAKREKKNRK